jgi:DNA-binding MarR family transcriptional regulator
MGLAPTGLAAPSDPTECPDCLVTNLGWLLGQAYFALGSEIGRAFAPLGVSPRGYHVLEAALTGEYTQTELADMVGLDKTTMVVTIDQLEASGLAERRASELDRRARVIAVTKAGKRKAAEGRATVEAVQADVLETLPVEDRKVFLESLAELVRERLADPVECSPPMRRKQLK